MPTQRENDFRCGPWNGLGGVTSASFVCGYCENLVASASGFATSGNAGPMIFARVCPHCRGLTIFGRDGVRVPAALPGNAVESLPPIVGQVYGEARAALGGGAPTGAALLFRTLLMHVACHVGAAPGLTFVEYVNHLEATHHVPPSGKAWVDHIRKQGNLATHQLVTISEKDATELLTFVEMLLRLVFDFPAKVPA